MHTDAFIMMSNGVLMNGSYVMDVFIPWWHTIHRYLIVMLVSVDVALLPIIARLVLKHGWSENRRKIKKNKELRLMSEYGRDMKG